MILVTGATGFVGTNLVRELVQRGESVRILRRPSSNLLGLEGLPIEHYVGDVLDKESVSKAVHGCRRVFHLATEVDVGTRRADPLRQVNVCGTETVLRCALNEGIERLVFTSSAMTLGCYGIDHQSTEESNYNLGSLRIPYLDSKKEAEDLVLAYCREGLPAVVVNPAYMFGPWDKQPKLNQFLIMAAQGKLNFYPDGGLSVIDVRDVVQGHILALEKGIVGQRYVLSSYNMTFREFFTAINRFLGKKPPRIKIPFRLMLSLGYLLEGVGWLFRFNPELNSGLARVWHIHNYVSAKKAAQQLGFSSSPLEDSFEGTFDWLREYKYIE